MSEPKIAVYGLWHLGCVTAASLAQENFQVCGLDSDAALIEKLQQNQPPIFEPGLTELITAGQAAGNLTFTSDYATALREADVIWVAFDTPVDEEDRADLDFMHRQLEAAFPFIKEGALLLISSQVPVGFTGQLRQKWQSQKSLIYAYSPENLRLGQALKTFRADDRIVVGLDEPEGREILENIFSRFCPRLEWMSVPSAEMTKHALNAFLAVSVAMINEVARICEQTGADAKEVERGLKSENRIGPKAYLGPGGPFAGGTLARDLRFLVALGAEHETATPLMAGTLASNEIHKNWVQTAAKQALAGLERPRVAILGLTYKPGTDTVRRSEAVRFGLWLKEELSASVIYHDPVTSQLPSELNGQVELTGQLEEALREADLAVIATSWPLYREKLNQNLLLELMHRPAIIDQNRFVATLGQTSNISYYAVGKPRN